MFIIVLRMQARYHVKRGSLSKAHEESNAGCLVIAITVILTLTFLPVVITPVLIFVKI